MLGKALFKKVELTPGKGERMVVDVPMGNWDTSTPCTLHKCRGSQGNEVSVAEHWGGGEGRALGEEVGECSNS